MERLLLRVGVQSSTDLGRLEVPRVVRSLHNASQSALAINAKKSERGEWKEEKEGGDVQQDEAGY